THISPLSLHDALPISIPTNPIGGHIFPVLEYMDTAREGRTGINRMAGGPDPNTLNPYSTTATGANLMANAAQQRNPLIARAFARSEEHTAELQSLTNL